MLSKKELVEANKLIAIFMGGILKEIPSNNHSVWYFEQQLSKNIPKHHGNLMFHEDWGMLMPVIDKIELASKGFYILNYDYDDREEFKGWTCNWFTLKPKDEILGYLEEKRHGSKIEAAHEAVVAFIKFNNK